jgi:hypothetical protein
MFTVTMSELVGLNALYEKVAPECCTIGVGSCYAKYSGKMQLVGHFKFYQMEKSDARKVSCKDLKEGVFLFSLGMKSQSA